MSRIKLGDDVWARIDNKRQIGKVTHVDTKYNQYQVAFDKGKFTRWLRGYELAIHTQTPSNPYMGTSGAFDFDTYEAWEQAVHGNKKHVTKFECQCGAKHTSMPNYHLKFCPLD